MMLRKFSEASDVFNELILYVSRILKPGAAANLRQGVAPQLQRMLDKVLALTALVITLYPSTRIDDQCLELVEGKWSEKFRKLQAGETSAFEELFEFASPKYISPMVIPIYTPIYPYIPLYTPIYPYTPLYTLTSYLPSLICPPPHPPAGSQLLGSREHASDGVAPHVGDVHHRGAAACILPQVKVSWESG